MKRTSESGHLVRFDVRLPQQFDSDRRQSGRVACAEDTVKDRQTDRVTFVLIARIPAEGIEHFRAYENAVLPLLPEFNGRLERLLRNSDGTVEMHIISYASDADHQNYRNDPRRTAQASLLKKSNAKLELLPMTSVS